MIKRGVYAAGLSIIKDDMSLDIDSTIAHAEKIIKNGLHGVFFFGSTGQSQYISISEKKDFISKIAHNKLRNQFYLGTGNNSLKENIDLIRYGMEYKFDTFDQERDELVIDYEYSYTLKNNFKGTNFFYC